MFWRWATMIVASCLGISGAVAAPKAQAASPWQVLAVADVERLHQSVVELHPGMRDGDTPDFSARVEAAYRTAHARADRAKSYADWLAATQGFILSFRDGHTIFKPNLSPARVRWPGFLIDGRGTGWFVRRPAGFTRQGSDPEDGARIMACDGVPIADLLKDRLDGIVADWSKEPERIRQAFRLFLDTRIEGPPPVAACSFDVGGKVQTTTLKWTIEAWPTLSAGFAPFLRRVPHPISAMALASGGHWITLGDFVDETKLTMLAKELEADSARLRQAPFIVLDLRGNPGGNSTWGEKFAGIVWGKAAVDATSGALQSRPGLRAGKYFRGSPQAAAAARGIADEFRPQGPEFASVVRYWTEVADRIAKAPGGDKALVHDPCCDADPAPPPVAPAPPLYARPVYVLIDAGCFSSCVLAANRLVQHGAIAVGETTGQNEEYGEVADGPPLPSGLARYLLPISIIRQEKNALRLAATLPWVGAMDDDAGIENWIEGLAASRLERK